MFNEKIKRLREAHQLTQEEFAEKILVSRGAVSKWETGKGYPSIDSLKLISKLFDVTIDELISDHDISNKKSLDKKRRKEITISILSVFLILSLLIGWQFFKKTEIMRYTADEAMMYGFKGMSHEMEMATEKLEHIKSNGTIDKDAFANLCQDLDRDVFYSMETIAAFDYGVCAGYNDYDLIDFYCYISDVAIISENMDNMTEQEIKEVYDSLYKVCVFFNDFGWHLNRTDSYIGTSLTAYNFNQDKQVRNHLRELEEMTAAEEKALAEYVQRAIQTEH